MRYSISLLTRLYIVQFGPLLPHELCTRTATSTCTLSFHILPRVTTRQTPSTTSNILLHPLPVVTLLSPLNSHRISPITHFKIHQVTYIEHLILFIELVHRTSLVLFIEYISLFIYRNSLCYSNQVISIEYLTIEHLPCDT